MSNHIELYIKENNLLQLSLFYFGKGRPQVTKTEWSDDTGKYSLECTCKYGVPGSFDQDCFTACMRIWVKQGMPKEGIRVNYSDIARELHLEPPRAWVNRIKKSLKRLGIARYEFVQCFVAVKDGEPQKSTTAFSLFDSINLFEYKEGKSKRNSESYLIFPDQIQKNLEAKYYQLLDMVWYRALPEGLPRRLYEYLVKRRYHCINGKFTISEETLCRWLPIKDKNPTKRRERLLKIAQALIDSGYLDTYEYDRKKKFCIFSYAKDSKSIPEQVINKEKPSTSISYSLQIKQEQHSEEIKIEVSSKTQSTYYEALKWFDNIPYFHQKRKDEIASLPITDIAEIYPGIKQKYEEMDKEGKTPSPGWVYKAFMQKWRFPDKTQPYFPETPKGKHSCKAKELFDSWDEDKQNEFFQHLKNYMGINVSEEDIQRLMDNGKIWESWAPMFMEIQGLIENLHTVGGD